MKSRTSILLLIIATGILSSCKKDDIITGYTVDITVTERITGLPVQTEYIKLSKVYYPDIFGPPSYVYFDAGYTDSKGHIHFDVDPIYYTNAGLYAKLSSNKWHCDYGLYVNAVAKNESPRENILNISPQSTLKVIIKNILPNNALDTVILYGGCISPYITKLGGANVDTIIYETIAGDNIQAFTFENT